MNVERYLERIGVDEVGAPSLAQLRTLRRQHLLHVPFENIDVVEGEVIELDEAWFYDKVVTRRRGGNCFELNGAFGWLLRQLGYTVELLGGNTYSRRAPAPGAVSYGHATLCVHLDRPYLVECGSGPRAHEPFPVELGHEAEQFEVSFRLRRDGDELMLDRSWHRRSVFEPYFGFTMTPRTWADFVPARDYDYAGGSAMARHYLCTLLTERGSKHLVDRKLWLEEDGEGTLIRFESEAERRDGLRQHFGIDLG